VVVVATDRIDICVELLLRAFLSAVEKEVLKKVAGAIGSEILAAGAGVNDDGRTDQGRGMTLDEQVAHPVVEVSPDRQIVGRTGLGALVPDPAATGDERMLARFQNDVLANNPRAVLIWGFINDIHRSKRDEIHSAMARVRESFKEMVRLARTNGIEPILATEVTIRGKHDLRSTVAGWLGAILNKTSYQEYVNGHVLDTNRWIRKYAEENRIALLDFQPLIADEKGFRKKEFATEDGTHISAAAYDKLTAYAKNVFEASRPQK